MDRVLRHSRWGGHTGNQLSDAVWQGGTNGAVWQGGTAALLALYSAFASDALQNPPLPLLLKPVQLPQHPSPRGRPCRL